METCDDIPGLGRLLGESILSEEVPLLLLFLLLLALLSVGRPRVWLREVLEGFDGLVKIGATCKLLGITSSSIPSPSGSF